jgi:hypothetical protein
MIKEGTHTARGLEAKLGFTQKGGEQVAVRLKIASGEEVTWYGYFTEKTQERTLESLRHLGWPGEDLFDLSGVTANEVEIVVEHEEYETPQGEMKTRARVRWINAIGGGGIVMKETMDVAQAKAFAQRMRATAIAAKRKAEATQGAMKPQQRPATQKRAEPPPDEGGYADDDIPFARVASWLP